MMVKQWKKTAMILALGPGLLALSGYGCAPQESRLFLGHTHPDLVVNMKAVETAAQRAEAAAQRADASATKAERAASTAGSAATRAESAAKRAERAATKAERAAGKTEAIFKKTLRK